MLLKSWMNTMWATSCAVLVKRGLLQIQNELKYIFYSESSLLQKNYSVNFEIKKVRIIISFAFHSSTLLIEKLMFEYLLAWAIQKYKYVRGINELYWEGWTRPMEATCASARRQCSQYCLGSLGAECMRREPKIFKNICTEVGYREVTPWAG